MRSGVLVVMSYRNPIEKLAERFHVSPALLQQMNPRARFAVGQQVQVPGVIEQPLSVHNRRSVDGHRMHSAVARAQRGFAGGGGG